MQIIGIIPDIHAPLHNKKSLGACLNALSDLRIDRLIQLGDLLDLETMSSHEKTAPSPSTLAQEVKLGKRVIKELESICADRDITLGNHEFRFNRFMMKHAPALFDLVKMEDLFDLGGWNVTPYLSHLEIGKIAFTHTFNPRWVGPSAIDKSAQVAGKSCVIGHVHAARTTYFGKLNNKRYVAHCPGWLGSDAAAPYMAVAQVRAQWQQGFTVGYLEENGNMHLQPIPIVDGRCIVNGKIYKG